MFYARRRDLYKGIIQLHFVILKISLYHWRKFTSANHLPHLSVIHVYLRLETRFTLWLFVRESICLRWIPLRWACNVELWWFLVVSLNKLVNKQPSFRCRSLADITRMLILTFSGPEFHIIMSSKVTRLVSCTTTMALPLWFEIC